MRLKQCHKLPIRLWLEHDIVLSTLMLIRRDRVGYNMTKMDSPTPSWDNRSCTFAAIPSWLAVLGQTIVIGSL